MEYATLFDLYGQILRTDGPWNYYGCNRRLIQSVEDIQDQCKCSAFIKEILTESGKDTTYLSRSISALPKDRLCHIVSVYFLSFILYERSDTIRKNVNKQLALLKADPFAGRSCESNEEKFAYLWFLVCIFHDLGYVIENNLYSDCSWLQRITSHIPGRRPKGIPAVYTNGLLEKYAVFRLCRYHRFDHGICGAKIFYADMCKIREDKEKNGCSQRFWGKELVQYFNLASWLIACHNVFYIKEDDMNAQCYKNCGLDSLIYKDRSRQITLEKHSLLFLLCLVDSIDMMKNQQMPIFDWKKIKIGFTDSRIMFDFSESPDIEQKRISDLDSWLADVSLTEKGIVTIYIV